MPHNDTSKSECWCCRAEDDSCGCTKLFCNDDVGGDTCTACCDCEEK